MKNKIGDIIYYFLLIQGFVWFQNSIIWTLTDDTSDKWFLRAALSIICFGFVGVISKLNKTNHDEKQTK